MDQILSSLKQLIEKQNIPNAEQEIITILTDLDPFLDIALEDSVINEIENLLQSLFTINKGNLSIQCSEFISSKLVKLFKIRKAPKLWDMINFVIQNSFSSTIIATSYVIKFIGENSKAQIPRFVEHILQKCIHYQYASIYALRISFKVADKTVSNFRQTALEFTIKILNSPDVKQHTVMIAIKFLRTLVKYCSVQKVDSSKSPKKVDYSTVDKDSLPLNSLIELAKNCLARHRELPFIQHEIAILVARLAYRPFYIAREQFLESHKRVDDIEDMPASRSVSPIHDFTSSLVIINHFPTISSLSFSFFIDLLGAEITSHNHAQLFRYVRKFIPEQITKFIPLLPGDSRFTYFREISKEENTSEQLKLLKILCPDDHCIKEAISIAFTLIVSHNKQSQRVASDFFSSLAQSHPFLLIKHVHASLAFLKNALSKQVDTNSIYGHALAINSILSHLADKETIIQENKSEFEFLITKDLSNPNPDSPLFIAIFELLACLPKQFAAMPVVSKAIDAIMQKCRTPNKKLIKAVFQFRTKFTKLSQNVKLIEYALNSKIIKYAINPFDNSIKQQYVELPLSVLMNLCSMIPKIDDKKKYEFAFQASKIILKRAIVMKPSQPLVKSFFKHPLPLASELLGVKKEEQKTDKFLNQVIRKFPVLVATCQPNDRKTLLSTILDPKNQNATTLLMLASMCEAKITRNMLPLNLHRYLLSFLKAKNTQKASLQAICEILGLIAHSYPQILPEIFELIESPYDNEDQLVSACLLVSALFAHLVVPQDYLVRAINFLNQQMKTPSIAAVAIHALQSVILTHSIQLTAMNSFLSSQFNSLFVLMNTVSCLQPVTLKIIVDCFRSLIDTFSSELVDSKSKEAKMVKIILVNIKLTPISYAKNMYYDCCRSIYLFAHCLTPYAAISFPTSIGASLDCQLAACEAFSDYMKFDKLKFDSFSQEIIIPRLWYLLQTTGDSRAYNFIVSIASTLNESNLSFWVSTVRRVLVQSSLIDSTNLAIEPTDEVKRACVDISMFIVDILAQMFVLSTENLDDIVSSLCRATETGSVQLQEATFPVLQRIIALFKDRQTIENNGRLLDLYDSQFASVVKVGFQLNLSISGGFLSTYLTFNTDNMSKDPENCSAILIVYLNGLDGCQQRSTPFYSLAAHLCTVGRKYPQVRSLIQPFLITLTPVFLRIVLQAMQLWKDIDDWRSMNSFRSLAAPFFAELLPAFVWLQSISEQKVIDVNVLVSFFVIEMKMAKEPWQSNAAFEALLTSFDFCGSEISSSMLELGIKSAISYKGVNEKQMLINAAALLKQDSDWDHLRKCILSLCCTANTEIKPVSSTFTFDAFGSSSINNNDPFSPKTFAYLIKSDMKGKSLIEFSYFMTTFVITKYQQEIIDVDTTTALLILLFEHNHKVITPTANYVIDLNEIPVSFKLIVCDLVLTRIQNGDGLGQIPRFLISSFKKGGMHLIGHFLRTKPLLAITLLSKGAGKAAFLLSLKDMENARAFLWFIQLSLKTMEKIVQTMKGIPVEDFKLDSNEGIDLNQIEQMSSMFAQSVFILMHKVICHYGNDQINGRMMVWHCIRIIKDCQRIAGTEKLSKVFHSIVSDESVQMKKKLFSILSQSVENEIQSKKMQQLVEFSINQREKKVDDDGWETLEIGDSD